MSKQVARQSGLPVIHDAMRRASTLDRDSMSSRFHPNLCDEPVQTFQAFTADLERMADWLVSMGIKTVAMESTGVYWVPVYEVLEEPWPRVIVWPTRARRGRSRPQERCQRRAVAAAPACVWLLRASFRPARDIAALRAYLRLRERHLDYAAAHIQHMQKALTLMNLQLHHVVSDVTGVTGMKIIRAIVAGERDPTVLAAMRDVRCKASIETIRAALVGNYQPEHVFALSAGAGAVRLLPGADRRVRCADRADAGRC